MKFNISLLNAVNFAIIFGIFSHYAEKVFTSNLFFEIVIWAIIGFIVGMIFELMSKKNENYSFSQRVPGKTSKKLIILPVVLVIIVAMFYLLGDNSIKFTGQTSTDINTTPETNNSKETDTKEIINTGCEIMDDVSCDNLLIDPEKNKIMFNVKNNYGEDLKKVSIKINDINTLEQICPLECVVGCTGGKTIPNGDTSKWVSVECEELGEVGSEFEAYIDFTYTDSSGSSTIETGSLKTII